MIWLIHFTKIDGDKIYVTCPAKSYGDAVDIAENIKDKIDESIQAYNVYLIS